MNNKNERIDQAYKFIKEHDEFSIGDVVTEGIWKESTAKKNLSKLKFLKYDKKSKLYQRKDSFSRISLLKFREQLSQTNFDYENNLIYIMLKKSKQACLSAVQNYNNPLSFFKTETYIVNMNIALTALFQSIFVKEGWDYKYKKTDKNKDENWYDLEKLLNIYISKNCGLSSKFLNSFKALLDYFKEFRNFIEHRYKSVDDFTQGHCQSLLFCYEELLKHEFEGESVNFTLLQSLQFSSELSEESRNSLKKSYKENKDIIDFHNKFYKGLSSEIISDTKFFNWKVFLIPQRVSKEKQADISEKVIFIDNAEIVGKVQDIVYMQKPEPIAPEQMAEKIKEKIKKIYKDQIPIKAYHLMKLAKHLKWINEGNIINHKFMKADTTYSKARNLYYPDAEKEIISFIEKDKEKALKIFASQETIKSFNFFSRTRNSD